MAVIEETPVVSALRTASMARAVRASIQFGNIVRRVNRGKSNVDDVRFLKSGMSG